MTTQQDDVHKVAEKRVEEKDGGEVDIEKGKSIENSNAKPPVWEFQPSIPYPTRVKKDHTDEHSEGFVDWHKQLHINLSFVEALS